MPTKKTMEKARRAKREGKAPTSQAGEFVREEMHKIRRGEHGARSTKQAIAIGLSKARRAGVDLPPPEAGETSERTRQSAKRAYEAGQKRPGAKPSARRSRAITAALKREGKTAASRTALSRQAKSAARKRTAAERSESARKAARTKGPEGRRAAARKAAQTRAARAHSG
ncbi:MAG: hypothetical protein HYV26_10430 [Candidatus Hydrogenedentes bacterium]|nr:hypothetical protein [Candidatus Hydrogenedentota bacterium]